MARVNDEPRNRVVNFLPPIDVALKIYRIDSVNVRDNTFTTVFSVLLDWEDPSLSMSMSGEGQEFVAEQHFCPKYSIDNCDSTEIVEVGEGRRSHPRRDKSSWHVKWTSKYQATLKSPLNPESYPFDFQELRYCIKPYTVDSSALAFLAKEPYGFEFKSRIFIEFQHPLRWRRHAGHHIEENADWLPDFDIVGIHAERDQVENEIYTVIVGLKRDPTNIICNVLVSMSVTSAISAFSFFIAEYADALGTVLTALLTAVAFKLILAEQLPLTPKPSAIELYVLMSIFQFALQALFNTIIHLLVSNVPQGLYAPDGGFSCEAESEYYRFNLIPVIKNGTTTTASPDGANKHLWWCDFISVLNLIFFALNIVYIAVQTHMFLSRRNDRDKRQVLAESTWGTVHGSDSALTSKDLNSMFQETRTIMRNIAHDYVTTPAQKKKSINISRSMSRIDAALIVGDEEAATVPSIYNSPDLRCFFTIGNGSSGDGDIEFADEFAISSLDVEKGERVWCHSDSGVNPMNPAQRLARNPIEIQTHYQKLKFKNFKNVKPEGRCLESQLGAKCPVCDEYQQQKGHRKDLELCTAPRTWIIGACIHFCNPYSRAPDMVHKNTPVVPSSSVKNAPVVQVQNVQVVPESSIETKRE